MNRRALVMLIVVFASRGVLRAQGNPVSASFKADYVTVESTLTTRSDLVAALKQAFAYCNGAYESMTDASALQIVKFGSSDQSKFHMLNWNIWHTWEHYGNLVVYLRLKGLVPPSSQRR